MQAIKIVYWRNLLYIPVGSCWLFTFVYSAKIKYLALKSHRRPGDLTIPSAAKVCHLVMPVPTNPCHQKTLESFLDYQNWKYKLLEKLSAKNHNVYFIGLICYYGEIVSVCFPAAQVPQQPYTITSRMLSKLLPVMRHEVKQAVITTALSDAEGRTHPSKKCRREGQKIGGGTLIERSLRSLKTEDRPHVTVLMLKERRLKRSSLRCSRAAVGSQPLCPGQAVLSSPPCSISPASQPTPQGTGLARQLVPAVCSQSTWVLCEETPHNLTHNILYMSWSRLIDNSEHALTLFLCSWWLQMAHLTAALNSCKWVQNAASAVLPLLSKFTNTQILINGVLVLKRYLIPARNSHKQLNKSIFSFLQFNINYIIHHCALRLTMKTINHVGIPKISFCFTASVKPHKFLNFRGTMQAS